MVEEMAGVLIDVEQPQGHETLIAFRGKTEARSPRRTSPCVIADERSSQQRFGTPTGAIGRLQFLAAESAWKTETCSASNFARATQTFSGGSVSELRVSGHPFKTQH
jgi:hypothetical protein